jgi:hypothetical protein
MVADVVEPEVAVGLGVIGSGGSESSSDADDRREERVFTRGYHEEGKAAVLPDTAADGL